MSMATAASARATAERGIRRLPFTSAGWGLLAGAVALYTVGVRYGYRSLMGISFGIALLLGLAVLTVLARPRVRIERALTPDRLTVGEPAVGRLGVRNLAAWPSLGFVAVDRIDAEPIELPVGVLIGGGRRTIRYTVPTRRRGRLVVGPLTLQRRDLLGLFRRDLPGAARTTLWVHPRRYPVRAFPAGRVPDFEGRRAVATRSGAMSFASLRDYVRGDDPRRIHWRSTARTGRLIVRDHVDTTEPTTTVVLDTRAGVLDETRFEHAIEVAASLSDAATRMRRPVTLIVVGEDRTELAAVGAASDLDRLAAARQRPDNSALPLLASVERATPGGALVVVTGPLDAGLGALLAQQRRRFAPVIVVAISAAPGSGYRPPLQRPGMSVLTAATGEEAVAAWNRLALRGAA